MLTGNHKLLWDLCCLFAFLGEKEGKAQNWCTNGASWQAEQAPLLILKGCHLDPNHDFTKLVLSTNECGITTVNNWDQSDGVI